MIEYLKGKVVEKKNNGIVVESNGVGYFLTCPLSTIETTPKAGEQVKILTRLIVKEDSWQLYGFSTASEKELFGLLITVSGVGPKAAVALLSAYSVDQLNKAIAVEDEKLLATAPGVGKKTASRIIVELKEKMAPVGGDDKFFEARDALVMLGYSLREAGELLNGVEAENTEQMVKTALGRTQSGKR